MRRLYSRRFPQLTPNCVYVRRVRAFAQSWPDALNPPKTEVYPAVVRASHFGVGHRPNLRKPGSFEKLFEVTRREEAPVPIRVI